MCIFTDKKGDKSHMCIDYGWYHEFIIELMKYIYYNSYRKGEDGK